MLAPFRSRGFTPYFIGLLGVVVASVVRLIFDPFLGDHLSFSFHFLAVSMAGWTGGVRPAVVTAVLSSLVGNYLFSEPYGSLAIGSHEEFWSLLLFLAVSVVIGVLAETSLRALEQARVAEREKDNFLATVAHEMRSPISVIYYANALNRISDPAQPNNQLDVIDRQVQNLNVLIEDLLDISRVARGKIRLDRQYVEASTVIERAIEKAKPLIASHRHTLKVDLSDDPMPMYADPHRMVQVVTNLLTNAAKYTPDGGQIVVRAEPADDTVVISVRDNGIGIAEAALPRVFDLFAQVESGSERSAGGLGIGLALVRKITEMHGGSVQAMSAGRDRGSEFVISMPLQHPAPTRDKLIRA